MEVKDIIKQRRLELGLTMKEVAARVGVSEGTISRWESGNIENMRRDKVAALSEVLGVPIEVLMGWEEAPQPYYLNSETARIAEQIFHNHDLRLLFDAAADVKPEVLKALYGFLNSIKEGNNE